MGGQSSAYCACDPSLARYDNIRAAGSLKIILSGGAPFTTELLDFSPADHLRLATRQLCETRLLLGRDAFHAVEAEIDVLDLTADARIRPDSPVNRS